MYQLETGVPLPAISRQRPGGVSATLRNMPVGTSFFVADVKSRSVRTAASTVTKETCAKFACRLLEENGVKGIRIWRTA